MTPTHRYLFSRSVPLAEVESTLLLAIWGTESLHGEAAVRLDARHRLDRRRRVCVLATGTAVGRVVNKLFLGFLTRGFGADAFRVERRSAAHTSSRTRTHPTELATRPRVKGR